eukprot:355903-Chlamydomonas_euryale.AAC.2
MHKKKLVEGGRPRMRTEAAGSWRRYNGRHGALFTARRPGWSVLYGDVGRAGHSLQRCVGGRAFFGARWAGRPAGRFLERDGQVGQRGVFGARWAGRPAGHFLQRDGQVGQRVPK